MLYQARDNHAANPLIRGNMYRE